MNKSEKIQIVISVIIGIVGIIIIIISLIMAYNDPNTIEHQMVTGQLVSASVHMGYNEIIIKESKKIGEKYNDVALHIISTKDIEPNTEIWSNKKLGLNTNVIYINEDELQLQFNKEICVDDNGAQTKMCLIDRNVDKEIEIEQDTVDIKLKIQYR